MSLFLRSSLHCVIALPRILRRKIIGFFRIRLFRHDRHTVGPSNAARSRDGRTAEEGRDDRRESKQEEVGRYCSVDMITSSGASSPKRGAFILLEGVDRCGKVSWWFCRQAYGIPLRTPLAQDERRAADISLLESPCSTKTTQVSLLVKHLLSLSLAATAFRFPDRTTQGVFIASRSGMG